MEVGHQDQRVLFVAGVPRSGSTLLDLMLGRLPGHCDVGELFYLWLSGAERNLLCACGRPFADCPFWQQVGELAFGGWQQVDAARVRRLQARLDTTLRIPLVALADRSPGLLPGPARELAEYRQVLLRLYRAVAEVSGDEVVVDSTKRPSTAYLLAGTPGVDLRVVHVVRDPRGVVHSWAKLVEVPAGAGPRSTMKRRSGLEVTRRWVTVTALFTRLARRVPSVTVRYEDLVSDPRRALEPVIQLTEVAAAVPTALDFLRDREFDAGHRHTVAGGRVRMRSGPISLRLDEEWRTGLAPGRRRLVAWATWATRRRFGYR